MLIYDGFDFSDYLLVRNVGRPLLPPQNIVSVKTNGGRERYVRKEFAGNVIPVEVVLSTDTGMSYAELKRFLAQRLFRDGLKKLVFLDEPDKYYMATLTDRTEINDLVEAGEATLHFYCPDPVAFGEERIFDISDGPEIYNQGTYKTTGKVRVEMTEYASFLEVRLENTGEFIFIDDTFTTGDIVDIDLESETVWKNGSNIMDKVAIESDFFEIPAGRFRIYVSSGKATLTYTERWL